MSARAFTLTFAEAEFGEESAPWSVEVTTGPAVVPRVAELAGLVKSWLGSSFKV